MQSYLRRFIEADTNVRQADELYDIFFDCRMFAGCPLKYMRGNKQSADQPVSYRKAKPSGTQVKNRHLARSLVAIPYVLKLPRNTRTTSESL